MLPLTRAVATAAAGFAVAASALALSATSASAYVVCNALGECWRVHDRLPYPPPARVVVHEDGWIFDRPNYYRWRRDRDGHGYWMRGHWRTF